MLSDRARSGTTGLALGLVGVLFLLQFAGLPYALVFTLVVAMAWAIAAVGLDLLVGYAGQLSFGQAGFVGFGAYLFTIGRGEPFNIGAGVTLVVALIVVTVVATTLGWAVTRFSAFGFAVSTFFFAYLVQALANGRALSEWTGGPSGLLVPDLSFGATSLIGGTGLYNLGCALLAVTVLVCGNVVNARTGHRWRMVKYDETVASVCGLAVSRLKVLAFVTCCVTGLVAGLVYSLAIGYLSPDSFNQSASVYLFAMVVVGGMGTLAGPVLGAMLLTVVPQQYLGTGPEATLAFAALTLVFMVVIPRGIMGLLLSVLDRVWRSRSDDVDVTVRADRQEAASTMEHLPGKSMTVSGARVTFGSFVALDRVQIEVAAESFHAVVGPNGAGKTTLLNALSGIAPLAAGSIWLDDVDLSKMPARARRAVGVARTFQTPSLVPDLTALENVAFGVPVVARGDVVRDFLGPWAHRSRDRTAAAAAHAALDEIGFPETRRRVQGADLTMSEQKLVEIARAMASNASVILLDEPTAGLSGTEMSVIADALSALKPRGTTVVLIAHHIDFVRQVADAVTVMDKGTVLAAGPPDEVFVDPRVRDAFLGIELEEKLEHGQEVRAHEDLAKEGA